MTSAHLRFGCGLVVGLAIALALPASSRAASAFGCKNLESDPALPAVEGKHGFFFRITADLRMQHPLTEDMIRKVSELSEALKERGTTLIYVPIPTKSQTIPSMLPDNAYLYGFDTKVAQTVYSDQIALLAKHGVAAVDLMTAMQSDDPDNAPFFRSDFHWTSQGARVAARAIAETIKKQDAYKDVTPSKFETTDLGPATAVSSMRRVIQRYCVDSVPAVVTNAYETRQVEEEGASLDIFGGGSGGGDIALVGTSFSDAEHQNFGGFLSEYSGLAVSNQAITGGNQFGAITSYLTSPSFAESRPKFLVWENPIYNNLAQFGSEVMAELVAAARGECQPLETASVAEGADALAIDLAGRPLRIDDVIYAYAGDDGSRKVVLELHRRDGKVLTETVERSARIQAFGRFYLSVEPLWSRDLTNMVVKFDRMAPGAARIGICQTRKEQLP